MPNEQYEEVCKDEFTEIKQLLKDMHKKLFIGNGQPPITVQIDRLNTFKYVSCWFAGVMTVAVVGLLVRLVFEMITK